MKITQDITKLIGNTPLFELQRLFGNVMLYAWFVFIGAASTI